jgi:TolA-binding protein
MLVFWRARAVEQPGPPSNVVVQADTTAVWSRHTHGSRERIVLERGALFVHVDHSMGAKQLVIALPDGELEDIGTTFSVNGGPDQRPSAPEATQPRRPLAARSSVRQHDPPDSSLEFNAAMAAFDRGDCRQAATGLDRFIAAHPQDPRTEDASYLRVMALRKCGDERSMRAAAVRYLQRYPAGFRRLEVERLAR